MKPLSLGPTRREQHEKKNSNFFQGLEQKTTAVCLLPVSNSQTVVGIVREIVFIQSINMLDLQGYDHICR